MQPSPPYYAPIPVSAVPGQVPGYGQALPYGPPPYGYPPPYGVPAPERPTRHSPRGWALVIISVLVIVISGYVGVTRFPQLPGPGEAVTWHTAGELDAPPNSDAPASEWNAWARRAVAAAVSGQDAALLAGDVEAYLAPVDPEDAGLRDDLQRRFEVLHQMGVGRWVQAVGSTPDATGDLSWHADIRVTYCFGDPTCRPNVVEIGTDWRLADDRLVLTAVSHSGPDQIGPRPWEGAELEVATGARTVVATSSRLDRRLADTLAAAERAAVVADSLARWDGPPSRYVIFLASSGDWATWYGYDQPEWAAGVYVNQTDNEVVVNGAVVPLGDIEDLLTHELTHVATLAGKRGGLGGSVWWLVEGVADYAAMAGRDVYEYDAIDAVRDLVGRGWDGDPAVDQPAFGASTEQAAARYGVAFLAVRRMADVYGQDAMLDFFGLVVHDDTPLQEAAMTAFGEGWDTVSAETERFIREI